MHLREERRILIPQFSLRWMLGLTTACAFLFAVFGMAARGHAWAIAISIGFASVALMAVVYALLFACTALAASILTRRAKDEGVSPFRTDPVAASPAVRDASAPVDAEIVS
jgi:hypothetical protein